MTFSGRSRPCLTSGAACPLQEDGPCDVVQVEVVAQRAEHPSVTEQSNTRTV